MKSCNNDVVQGEGITDILMAPGKLSDSIPGISGTRNLSDNLSDLKAQVAANNKGISLVGDLIEEYGLPTVIAYMHHIQVRPLASLMGGSVCHHGTVLKCSAGMTQERSAARKTFTSQMCPMSHIMCLRMPQMCSGFVLNFSCSAPSSV